MVVLASRSKSCQKVEKLSKSPKNLKGLKNCKGHRFGGTFTKAPILRRKTRASVKALTVFRALFAWPRGSLHTTFRAIIDKAKLVKLLMLCRVCSPEKPGISSSREHSSLSPAITNSLFTPKFLSAHVLPPLFQL